MIKFKLIFVYLLFLFSYLFDFFFVFSGNILTQSFCDINDVATAKRLGQHVLLILKEDKPDSVLLHIGTNDVNHHNLYAVSTEKLASDIIEIDRTCKAFNVKEVFISSVLCRNEVILSSQINRTNELLNKLCKENDFNYISNSNITPSHLSKNGIHLNDIGTFKLGDNLSNMSM